jgi:hypothetical protein
MVNHHYLSIGQDNPSNSGFSVGSAPVTPPTPVATTFKLNSYDLIIVNKIENTEMPNIKKIIFKVESSVNDDTTTVAITISVANDEHFCPLQKVGTLDSRDFYIKAYFDISGDINIVFS